MIITSIIPESFVDYKKPSLVVGFPYCTMKCGKEHCQNASLLNADKIEIDCKDLLNNYYYNNLITEAIVLAGLEPFDSFSDMLRLIEHFRELRLDDIVIYTGYTEDEVADKIKILSNYENIIVKFGRFRIGESPHYDELLGVNLASNNQYSKKIS